VNVRDRSSETLFRNPHTSILTQESVVCPGQCKRCRIYVIQGTDLGSLDVIQGADPGSLDVIQGADLGSTLMGIGKVTAEKDKQLHHTPIT
jgi:hypothetical protein